MCWPRLRQLDPLVRRLTAQKVPALLFLQSVGAELLARGLPPGTGIKGGDAAVSAPAGAGDSAQVEPPTDPALFGRSVRKAAAAASASTSFDAVAKATQIARANGVYMAGSIATSSAARARSGAAPAPAPARRAREDGAERMREVRVDLERLSEEDLTLTRRAGRKRPRPSGARTIVWDAVELAEEEVGTEYGRGSTHGGQGQFRHRGAR